MTTSIGTAENVWLRGDWGDDTLIGGSGADTLDSSFGTDILTGGAGIDRFDIGIGCWGKAGVATVTDLGCGGADVLVVDFLAAVRATLAADWTADKGSINLGNAFLVAAGYSVNLAAATVYVGWPLTRGWAVTNDGNANAVILTGSSNADTLFGGTGADSLNGGAGDDELGGSAGADTFTIGAGTDNLWDLGYGADVLVVSAGATVNATLAAAWTATSGSSNAGTANLVAAGYSVNLAAVTGSAGWTMSNAGKGTAVALTGSANADSLVGGTGADTLVGGFGNDSLTGGRGIDHFLIGSGTDSVTDLGSGGADVLVVSAGATANARLAAAWTATADSSNDGTADLTANGYSVNLAATTGANGWSVSNAGKATAVSLTGSANADNLVGGSGADTLSSGSGNDTLDGGKGADSMAGGNGNDLYLVDSLGDVVAEDIGEGIDMVMSTLSFTLSDNLEGLTLTGRAAINGTGNQLANLIIGNTGANMLNGGAGNDTLMGGLGKDTLTGGDGADVFRYGAINEGGDRITDFAHGVDFLELNAAGFGGGLLAGTDLAASQRFVAGSAANKAYGQFIYTASNSTLYWDADGTGAGAKSALASFTAGTVVTASDLHLV